MSKYILRDYQAQAVENIKEKFKTNKEVVLSLCPSGGKTITAAHLAETLGLKTLILAHGTSILRSQWKDRLDEYGIENSHDIHDDCNIIINLPQSLYKVSNLPKFDLVIVDEAHEFYMASTSKEAGMVKKIIEKVNPSKILLLTGTPSKFIKKGIATEIVSAEELIERGHVNNVYFGIASTNENIQRTDYRKDGNLKTSVKFQKTQYTMDKLVSAIYHRLTGLGKANPTLKKFDFITSHIFNKLDKTMIVCNNISQAEEVYKYFTKAGIETLLSHSQNDINSENIEFFRNNNKHKVLIVVGRGILGFDMPDLVNVVDLTLSKNIDRIYQLYARVMRKSDKNNIKFFFKIVPEKEINLYKFYLEAALCMIRKDIISRYNGKNLNAMEIPAIISKTKVYNNNKKSQKNKKASSIHHPVDDLFHDVVSSSQLLVDIYNKIGRVYNEFAFTTLGKIQEINYNKKRPIIDITEEMFLNILKTGEVSERIYGEF